MESRKNRSQKPPKPRAKAKKSRFQIQRLEERIAPACVYYYKERCCGQGHGPHWK